MKFALAMMLLFSCVSVAAGDREVSDQVLSLGLSPILGMYIFVGVICFAIARNARHVESTSGSDENRTPCARARCTFRTGLQQSEIPRVPHCMLRVGHIKSSDVARLFGRLQFAEHQLSGS